MRYGATSSRSHREPASTPAAPSSAPASAASTAPAAGWGRAAGIDRFLDSAAASRVIQVFFFDVNNFGKGMHSRADGRIHLRWIHARSFGDRVGRVLAGRPGRSSDAHQDARLSDEFVRRGSTVLHG